MATTDSNFFEIQRRGYQWSRYSTLDDGVTPLLWDNDPNLCVSGRTPGETKLVSMPIGALYIRSNGDLYYKRTMPNVWAYISSNVQQTANHFVTYEFTNALEWIVTHNKNTTVFNETLFDSDGNKFYAPVKILDANSFTVKLSSATSGKIHVLFDV